MSASAVYTRSYATKAELPRPILVPEGAVVFVTRDSNAANNGFYVKSGGAWVQFSTGGSGGSGLPGADGKTVRNGAGAPAGTLGVAGDFYIDTTAKTIYGPKSGSGWGAPTSLIGSAGAEGSPGIPGEPGAAGAAGAAGQDGRSVLHGSGAPSVIVGADGDFYIDLDTHTFYGPRTAGAWQAGVALVGPPGDTGAAGPQGPQGIQGLKGDKGDTGAAGPQGIQGIQGIQGLKGDTGDTGATGATGLAATTLTGPTSYGTASSVPKLTINASGQISAVTNTAIELDASAIISGTVGIPRGGTGLSSLGAANSLLRVNAGATALEYVPPESMLVEPMHFRVTTANPHLLVAGSTAVTHYHTASHSPYMSSQQFTNDYIKGMLYWSGSGNTVDQIGIYVSTAAVAGSLARVGIYEMNQLTFYPTNLVADSGSLDITTTGFKSASITATLKPNAYYMLVATSKSADTAARGYGGNVQGFTPYGFPTDTGRPVLTYPAAILEVARTYDVLPAVFPTGGALRYGGTQVITPYIRLAA